MEKAGDKWFEGPCNRKWARKNCQKSCELCKDVLHCLRN